MKMKHHFRIKKKENKEFLFIIFLIILLVFIFQTNFMKNIINKFFEWKNEITVEVKTKSIILNDYYFFENLDLKERLNYQEKTFSERKLFSVISSGKNNIYSTFLILDPHKVLEKNDLVLGAFNFAIGRIVEDGSVSKLRLFSAFGEKNTFFLADPKNNIFFNTEVVGKGGGILKVIVNRDVEISTSAVLKLVEEKEYLVAKFVKEKFKTQDPSKILYFQILINPYALDKVEVEK